VGRRGLRSTGLVAAVAACAALCAPAAAATGFSWSQPGDFTATGSGANPEQKYSQRSWSYSASSATLGFANSFAGVGGKYTGWVDSSSSPTTWIGVPAAGGATTVQMVPAEGKSVALTWTAPAAEQVTVSGTVTEPNAAPGLLAGCGTSWSLSNVPGASGTATGTIASTQVQVSASKKLVLTVTDASHGVISPYTASCDDTEVSLSITAPAPASAITLTGPTANQTFTAGEPTFAGAAGDGIGYDGQVKVRVYSGSSASGAPVQTLTTAESSGSWSVPANPLQNGTFTAQAQQDDVLGNADLSSPVTFAIANPSAPTVTLNSPGSPFTTPTPALTGTAGTAAGDASVEVAIAPASQPADVVRAVQATVAPGGGFTAQVIRALPDGQYQATASQSGTADALGQSAPVLFSIKVHAPAVTLTSPGAGASLAQRGATFSGAAGTVYGDSSTVLVSLWHGTSTKGKPLGTVRARVTGTTWSVTWPHQLALGLYTVQASQSDDAGHTSHTAARTFLAVPSSTTIGDGVTLTRSGTAYLSISCLAPTGSYCRGTVLVVTAKAYAPIRGGPTGQVRVLFAYVDIPGGQAGIARRPVSGAVKRLLERKAPLAVRVVATLASGSGKPVTNTGTRTLKIAS